MPDPLEQLVKAQRIDYLVKFMIFSESDNLDRQLLNIWLSELTEDLIAEMKDAPATKKSLQ
ncbi:hypothetical protein XR65_004752 [Salmonella enterica subsp. enterica serovar Newport]|nr:hypothetical protein [Salmonella enterica subsp. enterica serovar Newport]